jgi:type II secretory ATPase GspE/PulE/Tfp pilus assembly ATPase PilB-like protein
MGSTRRNGEEWLALARMLTKLNLIDEAAWRKYFEVSPTSVPVTDPISYGGSFQLFEEGDAVTLVAQQLGIKEYDLSKPEISTSSQVMLDGLATKVPQEMWREYRAIPILRERGMLVIAYSNPLSRDAKQTIDFALGESTRIAIAPEDQILSFLVHGDVRESRGPAPSLHGIDFSGVTTPVGQTDVENTILSVNDVEAAPIVRFVNKIFLDAFDRGASDIHISPEKTQLTVKVRADGMMTDLMVVPASVSSAVVSRIKLLAGMDISEKRRPQDGRIRINLTNSYKDLRVSTVPTLYGENVVARVLNSDLTSITFDTLGFPNDLLSSLTRDLHGTSQVVLVTGPTGSGKTSTLYAAVTALKDGLRNIITIEDPIEYRVNGVTQIQVNTKIGMTFAEAIRSVLRQDPDVVVIGEVRDGETATIAMQAAQTGHIVLATLHANSSPAAITRLRDLEIPTYLISSSIRGVLSQRLVRKLCSSCAVPDIRDTTFKVMGRFGRDAAPREHRGCPDCCNTGYQGRVGVYSYLPFTDQVKEAVRVQKGEAEIEALARSAGYKTLEEAALELVAAGTTSLDEVIRVLGQISPTIPQQRNATPTPPTAIKEPASHWPTKPVDLATAPMKQPLADKLRKRRVLLVEDDENLRTVITMTLEKASFEVAQAVNGKDALSKIKNQLPDIVVCDLMMPEMNGAETVQRLRAAEATKKIPILMLTSADSDENEVRLLKSGADDFVSKGAGRKVFLSRINRLLERVYG